jgi:circadian clock protein KaiB
VTVRGRLRLFVTDRTTLSLRAIENLAQILDRELVGQYEVEIVDVLEDPAAAEDARIVATPTLLRYSPGPPRRLIGDLSDHAKVVDSLRLAWREAPAAREGGEA